MLIQKKNQTMNTKSFTNDSIECFIQHSTLSDNKDEIKSKTIA
jgi:hypothetical protein